MKRHSSFWLNLIILLAGVSATIVLYNVFVQRARRSMVNVELETIAEYQIKGKFQSVEFMPVVWDSLVLANGGEVKDFSNRSEKILKDYDNDMVESFQVAPAGMIQYVYPYTFSDEINKDVESAPYLGDIAVRARYTGMNTVSEPVPMDDGDYRIYFCHPIYLKDRVGKPQFWGYSIVTSRASKLFGGLGLENTSTRSTMMCYRMDSRNGDQILFDDTEGKLHDPVRSFVSVPTGIIVLEGMWEGGWITGNEKVIEILIAAVVLVLGALLLMNMRIRKNMRTLSQISFTDELTGLYNRHMLREMFEDLDGKQTHIAMLFVDFDHFKTINDTKGHDAGDEALRQGAAFFVSVFGKDACFRYGGDEFLMMMTDIPDEEAFSLAARLKELRGITFGDEVIPVTVSGGFAAADCSSISDIRSLLRMADENLYNAKEHGRDQIIGGEA